MPTGESTIAQTLPEYRAHLKQRYAPKTVSMYWGDVRDLSVYLTGAKVKDVSATDLEQWIETQVSEQGKGVERKTLTRKVSALYNYFGWLCEVEALTADPTASIINVRIQSPLPEYLYEHEIQTMYLEASRDPRMYLLVLLFLDIGIKRMELVRLTNVRHRRL